MAKPNNAASKILEVIWERNNNTHGTKSLPRMKEINIEDSVIKIKKSPKHKNFLHDIRTNEKLCVEYERKPVKRSLFQEKKKEKVHEHFDLNNSETKTHCVPRTTSLTEASEIHCIKSPQIYSNREILQRIQDASFCGSEKKLFQTESSKYIDLSSSRRNITCNYTKSSNDLSETPQMLCLRSPEMLSNRGILKRNQDTSFHNFEHCLFQTEGTKTVKFSTTHRNSNISTLKLLPETKMVDIDDSIVEFKKSSKSHCFSRKIDKISTKCGYKLTKRNLIQENEKVYKSYDSDKLKNKTHHEPRNNFIIRSDDLSSKASQMFYLKSPQILSNNEVLERDQDTSFHNFDQRLFETEGKKTVELSTTHRNSNIPALKFLPEPKMIDIDDGTIELKKSSKSDCFSRKIDKISAKYRHKLVKRSLFSENENVYRPYDSDKLKNITYECRNSLSTRSDDLSETSQMSPLKSPQILSNKEILERNQNTLHPGSNSRLVQTESVKNAELSPPRLINNSSIITSLDNMDQICLGSKSPEIMANRGQWYTEQNDLNKINVSSYDKLVTQSSTNFNEKFENAYSSEVQSGFKSVDSEDIIESSEIIYPLKKQKLKRKKNSKKNKIKKYNDKSRVHELKCNEKYEIKLRRNEFPKSIEITKTNIDNTMNDEINFDSLDIINTENMLKSPIIELKIKNKKKKPKVESRGNPNCHITELIEIENNNRRKHYEDTYLVVPPSSSADSKVLAEHSTKNDDETIEPREAEHCLNQGKDENLIFSHSSEVNVIPPTPEPNVGKSAIEDYFPKPRHLDSYIPLIEVDQSPKIHDENNQLVLIQSVQSPPDAKSITTSPVLFEPLISPTQSSGNSEMPFKIDSVESPYAMYDNDHFVSPVFRKKKTDQSPSPNHFDSAKKRKKICKDGFRRQFLDLINRKKSEACIREYEKNLSKSYLPKHGETTLLNVIEAWKEFQTFILLCYQRKTEMEIQKVLIILDKCPKNASKNSVIRIYSPWLTIESKTTEVLLYVGVIHAEVIEFLGPIRSIEPVGLFTNHINGLRTTVYQNEVLWKCNCSEDAACQCLGELSVYNYLQYMISH